MSSRSHAEVRAAADGLCGKDDISLVDVLTLAEASISSLKTFIDSLDSTIYREFRDIAAYIQKTKAEIGRLQANDLRARRIPEAGHELDEVVNATEKATTRIMECAETILDADPEDPDAYRRTVAENVTLIIETCAFQDLTGQRIAKVVETLEHIEKRVGRFAAAIGAQDADGSASPEEAERSRRRKDQLLHGPAGRNETVSQDDIDALLEDGEAAATS